MRVRLPVFALVVVGTILIALIPFPHDARREISIAGVIFFALVAAAFLLPWERLPEWAWLIIPIGYIAVIAIIRDAQGGSELRAWSWSTSCPSSGSRSTGAGCIC